LAQPSLLRASTHASPSSGALPWGGNSRTTRSGSYRSASGPARPSLGTPRPLNNPVAQRQVDPGPGDDPSTLQTGDRVNHFRFGEGRIDQLEGAFPDTKATITFDQHGTKQILLKFARLTKVSDNEASSPQP